MIILHNFFLMNLKKTIEGINILDVSEGTIIIKIK